MDDGHNADVVLEGGGVKGIALVGALSVLMDSGYVVQRVAGTSAGAIVGALVAAGKSAHEMRSIMAATEYSKFQDESWLDKVPGGKLVSLFVDNGIYEGDYLREWLAGVLGDVDTFADVALPEDQESTLGPDESYRLVVNVSDVSLGRLVRFPWDYKRIYGLDADEQTIVDAVRASMSIPFFFEPSKLDYERAEDGGTKKVTSVFVDGGMLSNFPVDIFDRSDGRSPRWPTFGIKLSSRPGALAESFPKDVDSPSKLARAMIGTMTSYRDAMYVDRPDIQARTIFVDTFGVKATDFDLDEDTANRLYESGVRAATAFLETWNFEEYKIAYR